MPQGISLAELLSQAASQDDKKLRQHPIDPLAQAMELRSRFQTVHGDTLQFPQHTAVGRLFKEKAGVRRYLHDPVLIVWRMLDMEDSQDWEIVKDYISKFHVLDRFDCVTGMLNEEGTTVMAQPHSLCLLTPYIPDGDA